MGAYGDDNRTPHWDKEKEVLCPVCDGEDDCCENCDGTGTELLTGYEAEQAEKDEKESYYEDFEKEN